MAFLGNVSKSAERGVYRGVERGVESGIATVISRGIVKGASKASDYIGDEINKINFCRAPNQSQYRITINNHTNSDLIYIGEYNNSNKYKLSGLNCLNNSCITQEWNAKNFSFGAVYSIGDSNLYLILSLSSPLIGCDKINVDLKFGGYNVKQLWKAMDSNDPICKHFKSSASSASSQNNYSFIVEAKFEVEIINTKNKVWRFDLYHLHSLNK